MPNFARESHSRIAPIPPKPLPVSSVSIRKRMWKFALGFVATTVSWLSLAVIFGFASLFLLVIVFGSDLPTYDELGDYSPPTISRIFSTEGKLIDEFAAERRLFTPIEEIPDLVINAVISAEDKFFFEHRGYDPIGILKAGIQALQGDRLRGASTISQQVMKNFILSGERSIERKIKEIILAVKLDRSLGKERILELYLNQIFMGQNSYGVTAAAQTYFNKTLDELTIAEAAYLASLPKAPSNYHPTRQYDRALVRRDFVIKEMVENGFISELDGENAWSQDLKTVFSGDYPPFRASLPPRSYFTDEIRRQLSDRFGQKELFEGGLNVRATINPDLQTVAENALRKTLANFDRIQGKWVGTGITLQSLENLEDRLRDLVLPRDINGWHLAVIISFDDNQARIKVEGLDESVERFIPIENIQWVKSDSNGQLERGDRSFKDFLEIGEVVYVTPISSSELEKQVWDLHQIPEVQGAFIAMDTQTARVLSMVGGFSYQYSSFNRATQAYRQPGSAFKPIVYATALDSGFTPASVVFDAPIEIETPEGLWRPSNYTNKFFGAVTLRTGLELSRNLMTIRLAREVGLDKVSDYAVKTGVYDDMPPLIANSLGSKETTLMKLAVAYAMFANGGQRVSPTLVDRVQDREGKTIYLHTQQNCTNCRVRELPRGSLPEIITERPQVINPITAYQVTSMLTGVVENGTGSHYIDTEFPVAGKTGTTNDAKDAWFIGYTPEIVAGCYVGYDNPRSLGRRATGGRLCGVVFNDFIKAIEKTIGTSDFVPPEGGLFVEINRKTGDPVIANEGMDMSQVVAEFFRYGTEPEIGNEYTIDGGFEISTDLEVVEFTDWDKSLTDTDNYTIIPATDGKTVQEGNLIQNDSLEERPSFFSISAGGLY